MKGLKENGQLTEYEHRMILDMSRVVLEHIAAKYDNVREGVEAFMGGNIIETEASRIYNEGRSEGETHGIAIGESRGIAIGESREKWKTALRLHARGNAPADIADILEVDVRQVQKWIRN